MTDWNKMIAARTRHGCFRGRGAASEDAYFEFFSGGEPLRGPIEYGMLAVRRLATLRTAAADLLTVSATTAGRS